MKLYKKYIYTHTRCYLWIVVDNIPYSTIAFIFIVYFFTYLQVRMLHETYPANCEQVSRQVLLIHDVEVLDRLSSSPYNKFLYQYTSESTPRQTYANMVGYNCCFLCIYECNDFH